MDAKDPFVEYFGGETIWNRCERKIRRFISINPDSRRVSKKMKSSTVIKAETLRHLLFYRNKIHCFSRFRWVMNKRILRLKNWQLLSQKTRNGKFHFIVNIKLNDTRRPFPCGRVRKMPKRIKRLFSGLKRSVALISKNSRFSMSLFLVIRKRIEW